MSALTATAVHYAELGFSVFPAKHVPGGRKQPLTKHSHLDASADPEVVERMFARTQADIIGMVHDRFLVIDVDVKHGKPGPANFETFRHRLPRPIAQVTTSSGGWHWYFDNPRDPKLHNRDTDYLPGVDILAGPKGWIGVPPSVGYEFITGSMEAVYEALSRNP